MADEPPALSLWVMGVLGVLVGIIGGFGAVVFRMMIGFFHNLLFLGNFSLYYDASVHTPPGPWGPGVILVPVLGSIGVVFLVKTFAPEAKGHGVPEVMDAIYYNDGRIRPMVAVVKSLASALSIGSGGSVGREGPIIQIGAAFGSTLGQWVRMPACQRVNLIAAGAGAGIAATFNTPLGGVVFAMELMMTSIRARTILPVFIATATATYIGRVFLGMDPAFDIPALTEAPVQPINFYVLPILLGFGLVLGFVAALFVKSIYWTEDLFDRMPGNQYTRHMFGMLIVGVMIYLLMEKAGHYYVQGVGYATIGDILSGILSSPWFLILLVALKLLATALTLGSGASGGVFSPGLFIGAGLGGCLGAMMQSIDSNFPIEPSLFAVAGMAAMIGGTTGAVATGSVMIFEMTRDLHAVLPVLITVAVCTAVRKRLCPASIYTMKLLRRGKAVPEGMASAMPRAETAEILMEREFKSVGPHEEASGQLEVVLEGDRISGVRGEILGTREGELERRFVCLPKTATVVDVMASLHRADARVVMVMREGTDGLAVNLVGVLTLERVMASMGGIAHLYQ
ncbi:MAG: chloride channel protein [Verrucomicrobiota bacterium]